MTRRIVALRNSDNYTEQNSAQRNGTQYNDTEHVNIKKSSTQHNDTERNYIGHNDIAEWHKEK